MSAGYAIPRVRKQKPIKLLRKRLDVAGVSDHFACLARHAQAIEIRVKGTALDHSAASTAQLLAVGARLCAGEVLALQVRFFQDGAWWCDTVTRATKGFRLVRMRQGEPPEALV